MKTDNCYYCDGKVEINRTWAMPNKWTFKIKPIAELLKKYNVGKGWIDPFAGMNSPAEIKNDLNPKMNTEYNLHALDFVNQLNGQRFKGCLFDPPYSTRQTKECYESIGLEFKHKDSKECVHFGNVKNILGSKIKIGGNAISFGWNSIGFGLNRGFDIVEILLVNHGGNGHNDTIITVEKKVRENHDLFDIKSST